MSWIQLTLPSDSIKFAEDSTKYQGNGVGGFLSPDSGAKPSYT